MAPHEFGHLIGLADEYNRIEEHYVATTGEEVAVGDTTGTLADATKIAGDIKAKLPLDDMLTGAIDPWNDERWGANLAAVVKAALGEKQGGFSRLVAQEYAKANAGASIYADIQKAFDDKKVPGFQGNLSISVTPFLYSSKGLMGKMLTMPAKGGGGAAAKDHEHPIEPRHVAPVRRPARQGVDPADRQGRQLEARAPMTDPTDAYVVGRRTGAGLVGARGRRRRPGHRLADLRPAGRPVRPGPVGSASAMALDRALAAARAASPAEVPEPPGSAGRTERHPGEADRRRPARHLAGPARRSARGLRGPGRADATRCARSSPTARWPRSSWRWPGRRSGRGCATWDPSRCPYGWARSRVQATLFDADSAIVDSTDPHRRRVRAPTSPVGPGWTLPLVDDLGLTGSRHRAGSSPSPSARPRWTPWATGSCAPPSSDG